MERKNKMTSITLAIPDEIKEKMKELSWVNWSELARIELAKKIKRNKALQKVSKLTNKSKLTEKDTIVLANMLKEAMWESYKED